MPDLNELKAAAIEAASLGGEILMRYLRDGVTMRDKSAGGGKTYDLVSDADLESEQAIGKFLSSKFPSHTLLGEEALSGRTDAEDLWIIDPLDGTNNFAHGVPQFAVSIAYYQGGQPTVGVVLNPARDEMFVGVRDGGAFFNGQPIHVADDRTLDQTLIGCGFYYDRGAMMRATLGAIETFFENDIHGIRRFGAAALDLCHVACGQFGGFFEYQLSPWDFAAGGLILVEAGGKITTAKGDALPIEKSSVVASNGYLHAAMIEVTAKHHPSDEVH